MVLSVYYTGVLCWEFWSGGLVCCTTALQGFLLVYYHVCEWVWLLLMSYWPTMTHRIDPGQRSLVLEQRWGTTESYQNSHLRPSLITSCHFSTSLNSVLHNGLQNWSKTLKQTSSKLHFSWNHCVLVFVNPVSKPGVISYKSLDSITSLCT